MEAAAVVLRCSVLGAVSLPVTELAIVTDRPSRIQAVPRPRTKRVWNGDQRSRSRRAGMVLRIGSCCMVVTVITIRPSRQSGLNGQAAQAAMASQPRCCVLVSHLCVIFFAAPKG